MTKPAPLQDDSLSARKANMMLAGDPTVPLIDARWEKFAQLLAATVPPWKAYTDSGFHAKNKQVAYSAATRLMHRQNVRERVQYLAGRATEAAMTAASITQERVLLELGRVALANVVDTLGDDGMPVQDLRKLPRDITAAIQEITYFKSGNETRVKIKMVNKQAALSDLAKHLRMIEDTSPTSDRDQEDARARIQTFMIRLLAARAAGQKTISIDDILGTSPQIEGQKVP